jgi:hypothetical protein
MIEDKKKVVPSDRKRVSVDTVLLLLLSIMILNF